MRQRSILSAMVAATMSMPLMGATVANEKEGKKLPDLNDKPKPGKSLPKIEREARPLTAKTTRSIWHGKKQPPTTYGDTRQMRRHAARQLAKHGVPKRSRRPAYPGR